MDEQQTTNDKTLKALTNIMNELTNLTPDERYTVVSTVTTFFKIGIKMNSAGFGQQNSGSTTTQVTTKPNEALDAKEFLKMKLPRTDVERVACLAYYLTHYRNQLDFKTLDLTKLNMEAAQPRLSNAAKSTGNAVTYGYLVASIKGSRKLSAAGEEFVNALPDRDAAKVAMSSVRSRRRAKPSNKKL